MRKKSMIETMERELKLLTERMKFIIMVIEERIVVFRRSKADITSDIEKHNFDKINDNYNHLLDIKIHAFTEDKINELQNKTDTLNDTLTKLKNTSSQRLWANDLDQIKYTGIIDD